MNFGKTQDGSEVNEMFGKLTEKIIYKLSPPMGIKEVEK